MALDVGAAWRAWRTYGGTGIATQAFILARLAVAPLGPLEARVKELRGRVLSIGCGHGVIDRYFAELNPDVRIDGYDLNAERIAIAQATHDRSPRFTAHVADVTALVVDEAYDAAMCIDILHHIPYTEHVRVLRSLHDRVRSGGVCIVKEMARTPRPLYLWNRLHDRVVAGPEPVNCRDPDELAEVMAEAGFDIEENRRVHRFGPYAHYLVVGRRR